MEFHRTRDLDHVYKILTCPSIYLMMGDDYLPPAEEYQVPDNPDIVWLIAGQPALVGLFALFPSNRICWELHTALLPWASKKEKRDAARSLAPWLWANTDCKRITASIPECNRKALYYGVQFLGMRYVGRQERSFLRHGRLQDLIILGREICPASMNDAPSHGVYGKAIERREASNNPCGDPALSGCRILRRAGP